MDTSNDNIRKLLDMLDNPAAYSEQEISDIINCDEETRETYRLMVEAKRSSRWTQPQQPVDVDAAWQRFEKRVKSERMKNEKYKLLFTFRKIAAIFLAAAFLGGLAWASIQILAPLSSPEGDTLPNQYGIEAPSGAVGGGAAPIRFSDIRLDSILTVVSAHYGKTVSFRSEEAKGMKFIMAWNPDSSLTSFIDGLNMFDGLLLTLQQDTIFVETTEVREGAE